MEFIEFLGRAEIEIVRMIEQAGYSRGPSVAGTEFSGGGGSSSATGSTAFTDLSASHYDLSAAHYDLSGEVQDLSASHYDLSAQHYALYFWALSVAADQTAQLTIIDLIIL